MKDNRIVIGLDYGTTFTGVAFCDTLKQKMSDIHVITDWPGKGTLNAEKVPSQVEYNKKGEMVRWGYEIRPGAPRQKYTKLQLDKSSPREDIEKIFRALMMQDIRAFFGALEDEKDDGIKFAELPEGKKPVDVVTDYLKAVREHAMGVVVQQYGKATVDTTGLDVVVTVPAVWSDKARDLTFQAATNAGWGSGKNDTISIITEPEAAAIFNLKTLNEGVSSWDISVGDGFIVCDAGGGTVDLISYVIDQTKGAFLVSEAAVGTGGKCGATFLDGRFHEHLKQRFGAGNFSKIPAKELSTGSPFMNAFEDVKRSFDDKCDEHTLPLPRGLQHLEDDDDMGIDDGELVMRREHLEEIFEPTVKAIIELIAGQEEEMRKNRHRVRAIFMVGGLGSSGWVNMKVKEWAKKKNIELRKLQHAWSAVCRGACARGMEKDTAGLVSARRCRRHYGTPISVLFDPRIHDEKDAYIDDLTHEKRAKGQMEWLFTKGELLFEGKPKIAKVDCCRTFKPTDSMVFAARIAFADCDNRPARYMDNEVMNGATIYADLTSVPMSRFKKARAGGLGSEWFYIAVFCIEVTINGGTMEASISMDGDTVGTTNFEYH